MQGDRTLIAADAALSVLGWWQDAGVDVAISETPTDWLAPAPPPAAPAPSSPARSGPPPLPDSLAALTAWLAEGDDVPEAQWGPVRIGPSGDPASGLMILSDIPDPEDAAAGQLYSGSVGLLFDRMLAAIGRDRASVYLVPLASVRPPGGRVDAASAARLADIARHHIVLARPKRVLLMGQAPSRALLGMDLRVAREKKCSINQAGVTVEAIATYAPRFLLERPVAKADAWKDLQLVLNGDEA
ncbi:MAG: hypothetical protein ABS87_03790 [Sphingomonas sp. SCN 67-18]|nr:MAG: hypothetical protein ABS87_03790 [Sphingomonas sp. SCN 67-18]